MNQDTVQIAYAQFGDVLSWIGLLAIFLTPIVAGGITAYICLKAQGPITEQVWKEWREDPEYQKQKVTSSINYNE